MAIEQAPVGREREDLGELLQRLRPRLRAIFRRFRIAEEDADDRIQNVMLGYLAKRSQIHSPEAWICKALELECLMHLRTCRRRRTVAVDDTLLELLGGSSTPDAERALLRRGLGEWVRRLSPRCREMVSLRYGLDLDVRKVAERTPYKASSVDKVTRRCVQALSRMIASGARAPALGRKAKKAGSERSKTKKTTAKRANPKPEGGAP